MKAQPSGSRSWRSGVVAGAIGLCVALAPQGAHATRNRPTKTHPALIIGGLTGLALLGGAYAYAGYTYAEGTQMHPAAAYVAGGVGVPGGAFFTTFDIVARVAGESAVGLVPFSALGWGMAGLGIGARYDRPRDPWVGASFGFAGLATSRAILSLVGLYDRAPSAFITCGSALLGGGGLLAFGLMADTEDEQIVLLSAAGVSGAVAIYEGILGITKLTGSGSAPSLSSRANTLHIGPLFDPRGVMVGASGVF
jgi:hypothetical protein